MTLFTINELNNLLKKKYLQSSHSNCYSAFTKRIFPYKKIVLGLAVCIDVIISYFCELNGKSILVKPRGQCSAYYTSE